MIIVLTETGNTARLIAKYRPLVPIVVITATPEVHYYFFKSSFPSSFFHLCSFYFNRLLDNVKVYFETLMLS